MQYNVEDVTSQCRDARPITISKHINYPSMSLANTQSLSVSRTNYLPHNCVVVSLFCPICLQLLISYVTALLHCEPWTVDCGLWTLLLCVQWESFVHNHSLFIAFPSYLLAVLKS